MTGVPAFDTLLAACSPVFTSPSFALFSDLAAAWVLCTGRRTVTGMLRFCEPLEDRAHDAFHRLLREGAWAMAQLWMVLALLLVAALCPTGVIILDLDDTLFHKAGRKVNGAGIFRDAVRSTAKQVVYALGLNLVVLTVRIRPPWGGEPIGLPILVRLHRKKGKLTLLDIAAEMVQEVAGWFPEREFRVGCDGFYASLAGRKLPRTHVTSRMRRDAALYGPPPKREKGQRGRPRKKGPRLPTPETISKRTRKGWQEAVVDERGKPVQRLLLAKEVLWYAVCPDRPVLLVIVRDPTGNQPDDFFFTTDLSARPQDVASFYAGRWSIEDTFRNTKQFLGGEEPQSWQQEGPERAASLSFWLYSAVWFCYLRRHGENPVMEKTAWYPEKARPSFRDALAVLRRVLWRKRILRGSDICSLPAKIMRTLVESLAYAA